MKDTTRTTLKILTFIIGLYYLLSGLYNIIGPTVVIIITAAILAFIITFLVFNRGLAYQKIALWKYQKGDIEGALANMKKAVSANPENAKIHESYASLLVNAGQYQEAALQIDEALSHTKKESDKNSMAITKSKILWKQGKVDEAIDSLTELIKTFENTNIYSTLGFLYVAKGDYEKAIDFNLKAKDFSSDDPVILDNLGASYYLSGDYDNAYKIYQEVMKLKPSFPEAFYNYAKVLEHRGDLDNALYMVRNALTLEFRETNSVSKKAVEEYLASLEAKERVTNNSLN